MRLRIAVAQITTTLQQLTVVNQLRQSLGITTSQCEAETLAECDAAFDLLENGLSDVADRPAADGSLRNERQSRRVRSEEKILIFPNGP